MLTMHNFKTYYIKGQKGIENQFSSVQFSLSVVSDSLRPHESQHANACK